MRETPLYLSGFQQRDLNGLNLTYDGTLTVDRFMHRGRSVRQALDLWIGANLEHDHVKVYRGRATFVDAYTVMVEGESEPTLLEAGVMLIATGLDASPSVHLPVRSAGRLRLGHDPARGEQCGGHRRSPELTASQVELPEDDALPARQPVPHIRELVLPTEPVRGAEPQCLCIACSR